jgi:hypothetical protein
MSDTSNTWDIMGELDGITLDSPSAKPIPVGTYALRVKKIQRKTFDPPKDSGADKGGSVINVEYEIVAGLAADAHNYKGRKLYTDYTWDVPTRLNPETGLREIVPNFKSVEKLMEEKGLSAEEATAKNIDGIKQKQEIGKGKVKKLINAAGFIDPRDMKPGDENTKRVEAETAVVITPDLGFNITMLEGKVVMASTELGFERTTKDGKKVQYLEVKNTWDYNPAKVGDLVTA